METIKFKDWQKLNLRVGKIIDAEEHPQADKLYILEVDLGNEKRKLVAGLKGHYNKKQLQGKLCILFANLEPATIRGVRSEGMILAAVGKNDIALIIPEKNIELGAKVE